MATTLNELVTVKNRPQDLFEGDPIALSSSFQDISAVINTKGARSIILWVDVTIGTSTDVQFKLLGGHDESSVEYAFPLETVSATKIELVDEVREIANANTKMAIEYVLSEAIPYVKIQIKDAADGTGTLNSAKVTFKRQ